MAEKPNPTWPPLERGDIIRAKALNDLAFRVEAGMKISVTPPLVVRVAGDGVTIALMDQPVNSLSLFVAMIRASRPFGSSGLVWQYAWREAWWDSSAAKWVQMPNGRTSEVGTDIYALPAYNGVENGSAAALWAPGWNPNQEPLASSSFIVQPICANCVVAMMVHPTAQNESSHWFSVTNALDGGCGGAGGQPHPFFAPAPPVNNPGQSTSGEPPRMGDDEVSKMFGAP